MNGKVRFFGSRRSTEILIRGSCCFYISFCYHHKHHCNVIFSVIIISDLISS